MHRITMLMLTGLIGMSATLRAEEVASGLYVKLEANQGRAVARADGAGELRIGNLLATRFSDASMRSIANDNSRYMLTLKVSEIAEGAPRQMVLVIAGRGIHVSADRGADGSAQVYSTNVTDAQVAEKIAKELGVQPVLRTHPGHALVTSVRAMKESYQPGEPVTLEMKIKNVGQTTVRFFDGGSRRGSRNNLFGFIAFSAQGWGKAVPDIGDPNNFGGIASLEELKPGDVFTKQVNLSDWFQFNKLDTYKITTLFKMRLCDDSPNNLPIWDEAAVAGCMVTVSRPSNAGQSR